MAIFLTLAGCWYPGREQDIQTRRAKLQTVNEQIRELEASIVIVQEHKAKKAKLEAELRTLKARKSS